MKNFPGLIYTKNDEESEKNSCETIGCCRFLKTNAMTREGFAWPKVRERQRHRHRERQRWIERWVETQRIEIQGNRGLGREGERDIGTERDRDRDSDRGKQRETGMQRERERDRER